MSEFSDFDDGLQVRLPDPEQASAREFLRAFFDDHREEVFFSRQIEVQNEHKYFHWVTNRALRDLVDQEIILTETRELKVAVPSSCFGTKAIAISDELLHG